MRNSTKDGMKWNDVKKYRLNDEMWKNEIVLVNLWMNLTIWERNKNVTNNTRQTQRFGNCHMNCQVSAVQPMDTAIFEKKKKLNNFMRNIWFTKNSPNVNVRMSGRRVFFTSFGPPNDDGVASKQLNFGHFTVTAEFFSILVIVLGEPRRNNNSKNSRKEMKTAKSKEESNWIWTENEIMNWRIIQKINRNKKKRKRANDL